MTRSPRWSWDRVSGSKKAEQLRTAIESFIADLLRAQASGNGWVYRPKRPESFTGDPVGHRTFTTVTETLISTGLVETKPGFQDAVQWEEGGPKFGTWRWATRFRATEALLDLCAEHGVRPDDVDYHFLLPLPEHPLQRRAASKRDDFGKKIRGKPMRFDHTPKSEWLEGRIRELNEFLDGKLGGGVHRGYLCVFNKGDDPDFDWNKGGRLYSQGHKHYQQMPDTDRLKMTLDGEPVCEIDIRASYLTIFHALHGQRLDPDKDPYVLPGLGENGRDVVKLWFLATFGHDRHLSRWPKKMVEDYRKETGKALGKLYPVKKVGALAIKAHPLLALWGEPLDGRKLGWAELMYREADAIQETMFPLKHQGIASFSVHDSLIVPRSAVSLAIQCLANEYHQAAGAEEIALVVHSADEPDRHVIAKREVKDGSWKTTLKAVIGLLSQSPKLIATTRLTSRIGKPSTVPPNPKTRTIPSVRKRMMITTPATTVRTRTMRIAANTETFYDDRHLRGNVFEKNPPIIPAKASLGGLCLTGIGRPRGILGEGEGGITGY